MGTQIDDLVKMGDVETLYELLGDADWMNQLDAAEGLVKLGDKRGLEFLLSAAESEEEEVRQVAREILESPTVTAKRFDLEVDERKLHEARVATAHRRLQQGHKVFRYKMVYLAAGELLAEDPLGDGFDLPALTEHGLEGWEVVAVIPRRKQALIHVVDDSYSGAYFLLKKEVLPDEAGELDQDKDQ